MKNFKRLFLIIVLVFCTIVIGNAEKVNADEEGVLINIDVEGGDKGQFKAGNDFTIKINMSDLSNLFAASFTYTYDNTFLKVDSIDINDNIQSAGVYEPYKDTDKDGNKARYCFTLLGDNSGFSGNYDLAVIKGKTLKDGEISVGPENIKFQLINRNNDNMEKGDYNFETSKGDIYKVTNVVESNKETGENTIKSSEAKEKSNVKVELIKKSEDVKSEEELDEEQSESTDAKESNDEKEDKNSKQDNEKTNSKSEEDCSKEEDSSEDKQKASSSTNIIIGLAAVGMLCIAGIVIYKKNRKSML